MMPMPNQKKRRIRFDAEGKICPVDGGGSLLCGDHVTIVGKKKWKNFGREFVVTEISADHSQNRPIIQMHTFHDLGEMRNSGEAVSVIP